MVTQLNDYYKRVKSVESRVDQLFKLILETFYWDINNEELIFVYTQRHLFQEILLEDKQNSWSSLVYDRCLNLSDGQTPSTHHHPAISDLTLEIHSWINSRISRKVTYMQLPSINSIETLHEKDERHVAISLDNLSFDEEQIPFTERMQSGKENFDTENQSTVMNQSEKA